MALRLGGLALICAVALALTAGPARAAYEGEYLGINVQAMVKRGFAPETWPGFLGTARGAGFTTVRHDAAWGDTEPFAPTSGKPSYRWDKPDRFMRATAAAGLRWTPVVSAIPRWARDGDGQFRERSYGDFVAFATAFARRYAAGGDFWRANPDLPVLPPAMYEIWNEPNSPNAWNRVPEPVEYSRLFVRMRAAIKEVDPGAAVVLSLGWQGLERFVADMAGTGDPAWAGDGVAFHPYAPTMAGVSALMRRLSVTLAANGRPGLPLWVNEVGLPRAYAAPAAHAWEGFVADETRAATLAIVGDALQRSDCNVRQYAPYSLVEPEQSHGNIEDWMGILHRDGSPTAAFQAIAAAARRERPARAGTLALCGNVPASDESALLPLSLEAKRTEGECYTGAVRYYGNPLEQATVTVARGSQKATGDTDAFGATQPVCAPEGAGAVTVRASIANVGVSPALTCVAGRQSCFDPSAPRSGAGPGSTSSGKDPASAPSTARRCGVRLVSAGTASPRRARVALRLAARDACSKGKPSRAIRVRVHAVRTGGARRLVRTLSVTRRTRAFRLVVRRGDRQLLLTGRTGGRKLTRRIALRPAAR